MLKAWLKVHPEGIEPTSQEPESCILSIELQVLMQKHWLEQYVNMKFS